MTHYLACDLGAESGRLMLGSLERDRLALEEIHRFPNVPVQADGSLQWDIPTLFDEIKAGLRKAAGLKLPFASISTDSWGLDYMLFTKGGELIPPTFHYRDARTARGVVAARAAVDWDTIFAQTGIQFMPINTIYQLAAEPPERLARASLMLLIGDGFNYILSGKACAEESLASTSQLYNPVAKCWSKRLLNALQLPTLAFPEIVPAGTKLGPVKADIVRETGVPSLEVIATCSHDTGAAVAAIPATATDWAYISSGTWSLMGVELAAPIINVSCRELNFTNEIGFGGSVRLLKNIVGLWLAQECRREWAKQGTDYDYAQLTALAQDASPFVSLIDAGDPRFVSPGDMPARIAAFCQETRQPVPVKPGAVIRCVLESLALLYRRTLVEIEKLLGRKIQRLHIVGGGSRNALLNQLTADALQIPVLAGPVEATATGNVLVQAIALGNIPSLAMARGIVARSTKVTEFQPENRHAWDGTYERVSRWWNGNSA